MAVGPKRGFIWFLRIAHFPSEKGKKSDVMGFRNENAALEDCLSSDCERSAETSKSHFVRILDRGPGGIGSTVVKIGSWKENLPTVMTKKRKTNETDCGGFKGKRNL